MRIFLIFEKFFKKLKSLKFSPTADLGNFFSSIHSCAHFPSKWVNLYISVILEWEYEDFLHFSKTFQKNEKIEVFTNCGPGELFWLNSLMCPFSIQMSEFVYFSCPGVRIWGFSSFSETFLKIEKIKIFAHHGPGELFWLNSLMCPFSIQMSEFVYFSCPGVRIWGFSSFSKTSEKKIEKNEVFALRGPGELFWLNSLMSPFSIQMSDFVYYSCSGTRIWGFSYFRKLFKKLKNFKFLPNMDMGIFFWLNSLMSPFSIQMSEFVYFSCPGVGIWGFSSFSKFFHKIEKIEVFPRRRPGGLFWLNSLMCPFSIQMGEFVYLSWPGVRIWGFSSFSKTFQKIEKIEVFAHHGPGELFWLNSLMCPFSIQMSEFVYFSCPWVRIWGFSSFSKTSQKNRKKLGFRPPRTWRTFLAQFTHVPIFHPNEWICIL